MEKCCYGCGQDAKFTFANGKKCCSSTFVKCPIYREKQKTTNASMRGMKKKVSYQNCPHCDKEIATNNFKKHVNWCEGNGKDKKQCEICGEIFYSFSSKRTCSKECNSVLISTLMCEAYVNGKLKPYGGSGCRSTIKTETNGEVQVQSSYESRACKIFDNWVNKSKIICWEYTSDRFQYLDEAGKERTYFPDFKITKLDGTFYYLETKGFEKLRDKFKWDSVKQHGFQIEVWFEDDIIQHEDNKD